MSQKHQYHPFRHPIPLTEAEYNELFHEIDQSLRRLEQELERIHDDLRICRVVTGARIERVRSTTQPQSTQYQQYGQLPASTLNPVYPPRTHSYAAVHPADIPIPSVERDDTMSVSAEPAHNATSAPPHLWKRRRLTRCSEALEVMRGSTAAIREVFERFRYEYESPGEGSRQTRILNRSLDVADDIQADSHVEQERNF